MNSEGVVKADIKPVEAFQRGLELIRPEYWLHVGIAAVAVILAGLAPFAVLAGPMFCGLYYCYFKVMDGQKVEFADLFRGFDFFVPSLIVSLIVLVASIVVFVPIYVLAFLLAMAGGQEPNIILLLLILFGYMVGAILVGLIQMACMFSYPLIVEHKMEAIPALKMSIAGFKANALPLVLFSLLVAVVAILAAMLCILPAFLVYPVAFAAIALIYRDIFPKQGGQGELAQKEPIL